MPNLPKLLKKGHLKRYAQWITTRPMINKDLVQADFCIGRNSDGDLVACIVLLDIPLDSEVAISDLKTKDFLFGFCNACILLRSLKSGGWVSQTKHWINLKPCTPA